MSKEEEPEVERSRQRAEIRRIVQEEERLDSEQIRRALDFAMRDNENARVISEHMRKVAEEARVHAEKLRNDADACRTDIEKLLATLKTQGHTLDVMQQQIRELRRDSKDDWQQQ